MLTVWMTAPTLKMEAARMSDHRRPYLAVNGQTKKQAKKAVLSQHFVRMTVMTLPKMWPSSRSSVMRAQGIHTAGL